MGEEAGERLRSIVGQPSTPLSQRHAHLCPWWENQGHRDSWPLPPDGHSSLQSTPPTRTACCEALREVCPEAVVSFTVKQGWSCRTGQTCSELEHKPLWYLSEQNPFCWLGYCGLGIYDELYSDWKLIFLSWIKNDVRMLTWLSGLQMTLSFL